MTLKNDLSLCTAGSVSWHLILVEEGRRKCNDIKCVRKLT